MGLDPFHLPKKQWLLEVLYSLKKDHHFFSIKVEDEGKDLEEEKIQINAKHLFFSDVTFYNFSS